MESSNKSATGSQTGDPPESPILPAINRRQHKQTRIGWESPGNTPAISSLALPSIHSEKGQSVGDHVPRPPSREKPSTRRSRSIRVPKERKENNARVKSKQSRYIKTGDKGKNERRGSQKRNKEKTDTPLTPSTPGKPLKMRVQKKKSFGAIHSSAQICLQNEKKTVQTRNVDTTSKMDSPSSASSDLALTPKAQYSSSASDFDSFGLQKEVLKRNLEGPKTSIHTSSKLASAAEKWYHDTELEDKIGDEGNRRFIKSRFLKKKDKVSQDEGYSAMDKSDLDIELDTHNTTLSGANIFLDIADLEVSTETGTDAQRVKVATNKAKSNGDTPRENTGKRKVRKNKGKGQVGGKLVPHPPDYAQSKAKRSGILRGIKNLISAKRNEEQCSKANVLCHKPKRLLRRPTMDVVAIKAPPTVNHKKPLLPLVPHAPLVSRVSEGPSARRRNVAYKPCGSKPGKLQSIPEDVPFQPICLFPNKEKKKKVERAIVENHDYNNRVSKKPTVSTISRIPGNLPNVSRGAMVTKAKERGYVADHKKIISQICPSFRVGNQRIDVRDNHAFRAENQSLDVLEFWNLDDYRL